MNSQQQRSYILGSIRTLRELAKEWVGDYDVQSQYGKRMEGLLLAIRRQRDELERKIAQLQKSKAPNGISSQQAGGLRRSLQQATQGIPE